MTNLTIRQWGRRSFCLSSLLLVASYTLLIPPYPRRTAVKDLLDKIPSGCSLAVTWLNIDPKRALFGHSILWDFRLQCMLAMIYVSLCSSAWLRSLFECLCNVVQMQLLSPRIQASWGLSGRQSLSSTYLFDNSYISKLFLKLRWCSIGVFNTFLLLLFLGALHHFTTHAQSIYPLIGPDFPPLTVSPPARHFNPPFEASHNCFSKQSPPTIHNTDPLILRTPPTLKNCSRPTN